MIIQLDKLNPTEKEILYIKNEMEFALPLSKKYLEGVLYVLEHLNQNGIIIPESLRSN